MSSPASRPSDRRRLEL